MRACVATAHMLTALYECQGRFKSCAGGSEYNLKSSDMLAQSAQYGQLKERSNTHDRKASSTQSMVFSVTKNEALSF